MASAEGSPAFWPLVSAVVAGVLVALVSTFLTAEASRAEARRAERRTTYADFLGAVHDCHISLANLTPTAAELDAASTSSGFAGELLRRVSTQYRTCSISLSSGAAKVRLVAGPEPIGRVAAELVVSVLEMASVDHVKDPEAYNKAQEHYIDASARFETLAQLDVTSRVISPIHIVVVALLLVCAVAIALLAWLARTYRSLLALSRRPDLPRNE